MKIGLARAVPVPSRAQKIAPTGHASFDVPITIPHKLALDSAVQIEIIARDRRFERAAGTRVIGATRKPGLCAQGQLSRAQYRTKLEELRAAMAAGELTPAQFDGYDAELVTCVPP